LMAASTSASGTSALNISERHACKSVTLVATGEQKISASMWFCKKSNVNMFEYKCV
jgi:hypothetical protein